MTSGQPDRDERQAYLDELVRTRGYVLDYHKVLAEQDFEALKAVNSTLEAVYLKERTLDRKTKELLFVLSLTVLRSSKAHIKSHVRAALDAGASETEVLEAIELSIPETGIVAFQHGFEAWREVVGATGIEPTGESYDGGEERAPGG